MSLKKTGEEEEEEERKPGASVDFIKPDDDVCVSGKQSLFAWWTNTLKKCQISQ